MSTKEIIRESGKVKAKLSVDEFDAQLLTMCNGYQWTGQPMTRELAKITIEVLQEYLSDYS